jgi:hypothetical protein
MVINNASAAQGDTNTMWEALYKFIFGLLGEFDKHTLTNSLGKFNTDMKKVTDFAGVGITMFEKILLISSGTGPWTL